MMQLVRACAFGSAAGALAACAGPPVSARLPEAPMADGSYVMEQMADGAVRIVRTVGTPLTYSDGLPARRAADALCGTGGVKSSSRDRFETGAWLFPGGCA